MPRKPRFLLPGIPQHIIQRGNNREPCFYTKADYSRYLSHLKEALTGNDCALHAYVLMTNHVHLLVTPFSEHGLSHMMQDLGRKYVRYINHTYKRSGTLWEGRFKASLVDTDAYLLTCMRYIELNPLRANMVTHPGEYKWSSYAHNAEGKHSDIIIPHPMYLSLHENENVRQASYREFFRYHLDDTILHEIRDAVNQELVLGCDDFKDKVEQLTSRQTRRGQDGRPRIEEAQVSYIVL